MRVHVKGYGCSSSLADAEVMAGCLLGAGHKMVCDPRQAEVIVYNMCAVKTPTEDRMMSILKRTPAEKKVIVAGCLPLVNMHRLRREARFDGVVGPAVGEDIVGVVDQVSRGLRVERLEGATLNKPRLDLPHLRINSWIGILPISYGCMGSCTYCCACFARGKLRSYRVEEIVERVEKDIKEGVREIWLTSQDTACYGKDIGADLSELLKSVCSIRGDFLVRVGMMTPNNLLGIMDDFIEALHDDKVFKFLHLPIQSGDDCVLRRMNRFYSTADFIETINRFTEEFKRLTVSTDIIVGFPGETGEAFGKTLRLIEEVRPDIVNVSKFFARPKTPSAKLRPQIPAVEVKGRSTRASVLARRISFERNQEWIGWKGRVFIDELGKPGSAVGRNFAYKPIVVRSCRGNDLLGHHVFAEIVGASQSCLLGRTL